MKTAEEAKKYAKKIIVLENRDKFSNEADLRTAEYWAYKAYLAGYNEAMRWRDPVNDPPKCNDLMQIKYGDIFSNIIDYSHDRYLEDMGMWDIEQLANIKVLAWKPIK